MTFRWINTVDGRTPAPWSSPLFAGFWYIFGGAGFQPSTVCRNQQVPVLLPKGNTCIFPADFRFAIGQTCGSFELIHGLENTSEERNKSSSIVNRQSSIVNHHHHHHHHHHHGDIVSFTYCSANPLDISAKILSCVFPGAFEDKCCATRPGSYSESGPMDEPWILFVYERFTSDTAEIVICYCTCTNSMHLLYLHSLIVFLCVMMLWNVNSIASTPKKTTIFSKFTIITKETLIHSKDNLEKKTWKNRSNLTQQNQSLSSPNPTPPKKHLHFIDLFPIPLRIFFGASQVGQPLTIDPIGSITGLLAPQRRVRFDVFKIGEFSMDCTNGKLGGETSKIFVMFTPKFWERIFLDFCFQTSNPINDEMKRNSDGNSPISYISDKWAVFGWCKAYFLWRCVWSQV